MSTKQKIVKKKVKRQSGCPPLRFDDHPESHAEIVRHYKKFFQAGADSESQHYAELGSFDEALAEAAYAKAADGKRHPHQYRLKRSNLQKVHQRLKQYGLESCETFHELFVMVHEAIASISGIGELMVYDTAHRLGAYLKLKPEYVYLHAGVRVGATPLGYKPSTKWIDPTSLPKPFQKLTAGEMEDCLCIYKHALHAIADQ